MSAPVNARPNVTKSKMPPLAAVVVGAVVLACLVWGGITLYNHTLWGTNYAETIAEPLQQALANAGGVRKCSGGDNGRGIDNTSPWYYAVYEVPGNRESATQLVKSAAKVAGYNLTDSAAPSNPEGNKHYVDNGVRSPYGDLTEGNAKLSVTVFGSSVYNEHGYSCGVLEDDNPPTSKTTIELGTGLPEFKR